MQLTHLGHSTILCEYPGARILIDPGSLGDAWHGLRDLDAVLITHQHADHLDPDHLPALLAENPRARLLMPSDATGLLASADATVAVPGERITIAGVGITMVGGVHAVIHADIPLIENVGYVLDAPDAPRLLHPGDALDTTPPGIELLALPIMGPWSAMKEQVEFVRALGSPRCITIHEALLSAAGRALLERQIGTLAKAEVLALEVGVARDF